MDKQILDVIHNKIKSIWLEKIKHDYEYGWLLKEDTLKNALYYYLRSELTDFFEENNIRVFTEFTYGEFKDSKMRPDMVIAEVDFENEDVSYYGDQVKKSLAVIEIKYKSKDAVDTIYDDYDKLKEYINTLGMSAHLYMATIWESFDKPTTWIRKNAAWAKGQVTELNASYIEGTEHEPQFYVYEH
ncbi:MAG: hypothetical protein IKK26_03725 [Clostridia bacterium]|nr:hypothetical protein [Clostridia bacterium]MBR6650455.1 hypothetical protein [Clostridia bacterium]